MESLEPKLAIREHSILIKLKLRLTIYYNLVHSLGIEIKSQNIFSLSQFQVQLVIRSSCLMETTKANSLIMVVCVLCVVKLNFPNLLHSWHYEVSPNSFTCYPLLDVKQQYLFLPLRLQWLVRVSIIIKDCSLLIIILQVAFCIDSQSHPKHFRV